MTTSEHQVRLIQSLDELKAIELDWRMLCQHQGHVFQSFDWLYLWAKHYQPWIAQLHILTVWQQQQLVAALPCYLRKQTRFGLQQQQLWLIGTGEPEHSEVCAEYMDILAYPAHRSPAITLLARAIASNVNIDALCFDDIRPDAKLTHLMTTLKPHFSYQTAKQTGCSFAVPLSAQGPHFLPGANKKFKRLHNKLTKLPHHLIIAKDLTTAEQLFSKLIELHQQRWQSQGKSGVFASEVFLNFHHLLMLTLLKNNQLLLAGLQVDDEILAVHYCFTSNEQCWFYQGGINEQFTPNLSPGILLHYLLATHCAQKGMQLYDLMKSANATDYKSTLCKATSSLWQFRLHRSVVTRLKAALLNRYSAR